MAAVFERLATSCWEDAILTDYALALERYFDGFKHTHAFFVLNYVIKGLHPGIYVL